MSGPIGSSQWMYSTGAASVFSHTIDQSLRFDNETNSQFLSFTPSSEGNRDTWTISMWVKRAELGTINKLFGAGSTFGSNHNNSFYMWFQADDTLRIRNETSGSYYTRLDTTRVFRDVSAWYHIVYIYDSTQSTTTDRQKLYINGVQETVFDHRTDPSSNQNSKVNDTHVHLFGKTTSSTLNAYLAEINFLDGLAYDPSYFGETKDGVWIPKKYTGSYPDNSFYLTFQGTGTATTSQGTTAQTNIGDDQSGNGNNFASTGTNHGTTSTFVSSDVVPDSPTNNFATLNSVGKFYGESGNTKTFSEGNLKVAQSGGGSHDTATIAIETGHTEGYYWEVIVSSMDVSRTYIGIVADNPDGNASLIASYGFTKKYILNRDGTFWGNNNSNASGTSSYTAYAQGDIVMVAYKNGRIWFGVNGTWMNSGDPANGTGFLTAQDGTSPLDRNQAAWLPYFGYRSTFIVNFGQNGTFNGTKTAQGNSDENGIGNFYYSVPSGFLSLCTANLPDPTIGPGQTEQADDNFNTVLFTGNATARSITGVGFQPDWLWFKNRTASQHHNVFDSVRGADKILYPNLNYDEDTTTHVTSFDSDGYTLGTNNSVNQNNKTIVSWCWKAGGTASSNNDGSVTSSVSSNPDAGFSIVQYAGLSSGTQTVGHGLNSTPEYIIYKNRDDNSSWVIYSEPVGTGGFLIFQSNGGTNTSDVSNTFNSTAPTNSVFTVGTNNAVGGNGDTIISYCFHSVEGYSKIGMYRGNSSLDGTFVYLGFRPAWVLIKSTSTNTNFSIYDNKRLGYNEDNNLMRIGAGSTTTEQTDDDVDFVSNGLKFRRSSTNFNNSLHTYVYLAFAEAPIKFANAR